MTTSSLKATEIIKTTTPLTTTSTKTTTATKSSSTSTITKTNKIESTTEVKPTESSSVTQVFPNSTEFEPNVIQTTNATTNNTTTLRNKAKSENEIEKFRKMLIIILKFLIIIVGIFLSGLWFISSESAKAMKKSLRNKLESYLVNRRLKSKSKQAKANKKESSHDPKEIELLNLQVKPSESATVNQPDISVLASVTIDPNIGINDQNEPTVAVVQSRIIESIDENDMTHIKVDN